MKEVLAPCTQPLPLADIKCESWEFAKADHELILHHADTDRSLSSLLQKCGSSPASSSAPWPLLCKVSSVCVHAVCFVSLMLLISRTIYKEKQHLFSGEKSWDTRKLGAAFNCISIIWRQRRLCLISVRIRKKSESSAHVCARILIFFLCFHTMIKV